MREMSSSFSFKEEDSLLWGQIGVTNGVCSGWQLQFVPQHQVLLYEANPSIIYSVHIVTILIACINIPTLGMLYVTKSLLFMLVLLPCQS